MECSAKEGDKIKEVFVELAKKLEEKLTLKNIKITPEKKGKGLKEVQQSDQKKKCC